MNRELSALLEAAGRDGWAGLKNMDEAAKTLNEEQQAKAEAHQADTYALFSTEIGQRWLERLIKETLDRVAWPGDLAMPVDQLAVFGSFHEGRNSITRAILSDLAQASAAPLASRIPGRKDGGS